jgi:hypothetical protein
MGELLAPLGFVFDLLRNPQLWGIIILFAIFVFSIEMVEGYMDGPWPHQRRGLDRLNALALGSRSAWLAVAILIMPGLLLAVVNAVVRFYRNVPAEGLGWSLQWVGWGLVMLAWLIFVAGSANVLHFGTYLRRLGLVTPAALLVCLLLGNLMLLLSLLEVTR